MAESVVTFLLKKLSSLLEDEVKLMRGFRNDVAFVKNELDRIRAFLHSADAAEDEMRKSKCGLSKLERNDARLLEDAQLVGIESQKQHLLSFLMENTSQLQVAAVLEWEGWQNTLVNTVYGDLKVKTHFIKSKLGLLFRNRFIEEIEGRSLEEVGHGCFNELINRSLLQVTERYLDGRANSCRVHDILRETMLLKSKDQSFATITNKESSRRLPKSVRRLWSRLVKVLDCTSVPMTTFPKDITKAIPFTIPVFKRHQCILKLGAEHVDALFSSIHELKFLSSLRLDSRTEDEVLNLKFKSFSSLRLLQRLYITGRVEKSLEGLQNLTNLSRLRLTGCRLQVDPLESLKNLPNLVLLAFLKGAYDGESLCFKAGSFLKLEKLYVVEMDNLRRLIVEDKALTHLKVMSLENCKLLNKLPVGIEYLRSLEYLYLVDLCVELTETIYSGSQHENYLKVKHISSVFIGQGNLETGVQGRWL
ncbi:hypothetical protein F8388_013514 [Cannabis sativa]|uniref:Rx N-terminal domain-containing protein n=1 Tax=Cannabis sativa TaxID=3483 RepID=A0A7J6G8J7_CANSA|nr:hypothetical protein F8388_013514 [Cannabis sativa]